MARPKARKRRRAAASANVSQLRQRTVEALGREAFQNAQKLAKDLCKRSPTAEHRRWLAEATVGRAAELRQSGRPADAVAMLRTIIESVGDAPELLVRCAGELMLAGDWQMAEQLAQQVDDASLLSQLEVLRIDAALLQGAAGLVGLADELRPAAQTVLRALEAQAQGDDVAAGAAVATIPDASPLHDWKLFIQGLTAFYAGEPAALELWQQLTPNRAPAAMAASFRAQVDEAFLNRQPDHRQAQLRVFGRRLYAADWLDRLAEVSDLLGRGKLPTALRRAGEAWSAIPREQVEVRERLQRALYWEVARHGTVRDINTYARLFGGSSDDPELHRLWALHYERQDDLPSAQDKWRAYEQGLAQDTMISAEDGALARSLVWSRMGQLAENSRPPMPAALRLPLDLDGDEACPVPASECYRRSIELAPQNLEAHERLLELLHAEEDQPAVAGTARYLLEHFPEHQQALETLADDAFRGDRWDEAVALQERAVRARPHDTALTERLDFYQLGLSRLRAQQGQFDTARSILEAQLHKESADRSHLLCRLAAVEYKAGQQQRGEELFERACQTAPSRLVAVFEMLVQAIRMPLDAKHIRNLDREFRRALKGKTDGPSAVALLSLLGALKATGIIYEGLPAHERLILQYLKRAAKEPFDEAELQEICRCLSAFPGNKLWLDFATKGRRAYPRQPAFPFAVALYYLSLGPEKCPWHKADDALHAALDLVHADPAYADLRQPVEAAHAVVESAMLMSGMQAMAELFGFDEDNDEDFFDLFGADEPDDEVWEPPRRTSRRRTRKPAPRKQRKRS
jgi:tetratricopeptide (TPR) repeat protein